MIDKEQVTGLVKKTIEGTDLFLVEISVKSGNNIQVLVDSPEGVSIDRCVEISRFLNEQMDREVEDYSLEVSSPGLGAPFRVRQQYEKNIGHDVEVVMKNGIKKKGELLVVKEDSIVIRTTEKVAPEGSQKKMRAIAVEKEIKLNEIKTTKAVISFK